MNATDIRIIYEVVCFATINAKMFEAELGSEDLKRWLSGKAPHGHRYVGTFFHGKASQPVISNIAREDWKVVGMAIKFAIKNGESGDTRLAVNSSGVHEGFNEFIGVRAGLLVYEWKKSHMALSREIDDVCRHATPDNPLSYLIGLYAT